MHPALGLDAHRPGERHARRRPSDGSPTRSADASNASAAPAAVFGEDDPRVRREHALLFSIINAATDPILFTNMEGQLIIANARAEMLFTAPDDVSEGRRRAVQLNNMFFSAALSRTALGEGEAGRRELLLVDPTEGSDLLFELLSTVVSDPREGTGVVSILRNITDLRMATRQIDENYAKLRAAEAEVRAERDRLNLLIDSVADPIIVTDQEGEISLMNNPAERLFTVVPGSGEDAQRIVRANDAHFTSFVSGLLSTGWETTRRGEIALIDPNTGKLVPVEALAAKMLSDIGELTAIVTILHDRTEAIERNQLYEQLKLASEELEGKVREATGELANQNELLRRQALELEQASAAKSQFLANVSHELRTPLNAILGYAAMTLQGVSGELSAPQRRNLSRIDANARHLLTLINEILDITRIEAGRMPIQIVAFNLPELVREVTTELEPIIAKSGLQVICKLPSDLPTLRTDRQKVKQILVNLLSNALKFTPKGSITIKAQARRPGTGVGRGHRHRHRHPEGGSGENLRRLPPGRSNAAAGLRWHGSWFVDLPAADDDAAGDVEGGEQAGAWVDVYADPAGEFTEVTRGRGPAMKDAMATKNKSEPLVLVVDDFADAREMYGEYLKFCGFRVAEAQNGVEAIDKAKRLKPDLILMDLSMPVVDGWEATRRLKADSSTKGIPVVALTGHAMAGHSESAKSAGCDVVITKPCLPHDLIKEIKKVIGAPAAKDGKAKRNSA